MARPREFDLETALTGAMDIFWRQGYLATNLPDLLDAMGLTRGSFYKAFGDKEAVYMRALDHYEQQVVERTVGVLANCQGRDARECLLLLFTGSPDPSRGCFICNAMVELAPVNPEVARRVNHMAGRLRGAIGDVLKRYDPDLDPERQHELADIVLHLYFGNQAMGKSGEGGQDWDKRLESLLS